MQISTTIHAPSFAALSLESLTKSSQERVQRLTQRLEELRVDHDFYMLVAKGELQGSDVIINSMRALQAKRLAKGASSQSIVLSAKSALNLTASPKATTQGAIDAFEEVSHLEQSLKDLRSKTIALKALLADVSEGADERLFEFRQQLGAACLQ